jgi:hypothetical protein
VTVYYSDSVTAMVVEDLDTDVTWDQDTLLAQIHATQSRSGTNPKTFMTILRHALSAKKVGQVTLFRTKLMCNAV